MAVQEFVSAAADGFTVTVAPADACALRLDLDTLCFEALGNDQNYKEVIKDQYGATQFRFRYAIQARQGVFDESAAAVFGRSALAPLLVTYGALSAKGTPLPRLAVDPARAVATCLKPADDPCAGGVILRLHELSGAAGPVEIQLQGYREAVAVDLLETDQREVRLQNGKVHLDMRGHGFSSLRLLP
jgi:alpha-mannosidase